MSSPNPIGQPFIELLSIESTNNYAMGLARAGMAQHGTVVFTHEQTKGKGQRSKEWISQKGKNVAMTVVIEPKKLQLPELFLLSMMTAVSVRDFLSNHTKGELKIKWPNDIFWGDRKAAGILIENLWQGDEWKFALIGIGINANQTDFAELNSKAVSLKEISGRETEPLILAKELSKVLEEYYQLMMFNAAQIREQYKTYLYRLNEKVRLKKGSRVFEAELKGVTIDGQLTVQHSVEEQFNVGEVEWIFNGG